MLKNLEQIPYILEKYRHQRLRVGFSGGADSTALLLLLLKWGWQPELLEAVHFEHGLRGEASKLDALWCRDFCQKRNIKFSMVELDLLATAIEGSLEDAARQARLQWYRKNGDQTPVVLAHHANDAAETLLLKLSRGGNASALAGLRRERTLHGVLFLRPLLDHPKSDLEEFLRQNGVNDWRIDASNQTEDYHRNFLRNNLLKSWSEYHPPLQNALKKSFYALQQDAEFIESIAAEKLAQLGSPLPAVTTVDFWKNLHNALLARVLTSYLQKLSGRADLEVTNQMLKNFQTALQLPVSREKRQIILGNNCSFLLQNNILEWFSSNAGSDLPTKPQRWQWQSEPTVSFGCWQLEAVVINGAVVDNTPGVFTFDAGKLPAVLYLAPRQGGEYMRVWGSKDQRRVKHLLAGCSEKAVFLLTDEAQVIYLLANLRRSDLAPVTEQTAQTLHLTVKYTKNLQQ